MSTTFFFIVIQLKEMVDSEDPEECTTGLSLVFEVNSGS